jgi:hypothetical protein
MTKEEAKLLLGVCRPCGAEDAEPIMMQARQCLEGDSEARSAVEQARGLDRQISEKLCCVEVPSQLLTEILAGARLSKTAPGFIARYGRLIATAAALIFAANSLWWSLSPPSASASGRVSLTTFRQEIAQLYSDLDSQPLGYRPAFVTSSPTAAERYFAAHQSPTGKLPEDGVAACRVVHWRGNPVAICCMTQNGQKAHLFVIPRDLISGADCGAERSVVKVAGLPTTVWSEGDTVRALVGTEPDTQLEPFLLAKL